MQRGAATGNIFAFNIAFFAPVVIDGILAVFSRIRRSHSLASAQRFAAKCLAAPI